MQGSRTFLEIVACPDGLACTSAAVKRAQLGYAGRQSSCSSAHRAAQEDKKRLRCSHFTLFVDEVICPSGSGREFLSSPHAKNKSLPETPKSNLQFAHPVPQEGRFAIVTNVGTGCGGRGSVAARNGIAGRVLS
jgi:hypothetical protein